MAAPPPTLPSPEVIQRWKEQEYSIEEIREMCGLGHQRMIHIERQASIARLLLITVGLFGVMWLVIEYMM